MTGPEFRKIRLLLGLTQKVLADRLGIERTTIYRWEQGKIAIPKMAVLAVRQVEAENRGSDTRRRG